MTAAVFDQPRRSFGLLIVILLILAAIVGTVVLPEVKVRDGHAEAKHGAEAVQVRECPNVTSVWINKSMQRFNVVKELGDGRCGIQVIQPSKCGIVWEITAYIANWDGVSEASAIERMLKAKGCTRIAP